MKTEKPKRFIHCCILGAIGGVLMAAGDWLLGCVPLQETDMGMFNRAYYLSGAYGLWRPVLTVGLGALGCFLYFFMVKALNTDIDPKYKKAKAAQYFCGIFTIVVALAIHLWVATMFLVCHLSGAAYRNGGCNRGGHRLSEQYAPRNSADVHSDAIGFRNSFCDAVRRKNPLSQMDARLPPGYMEHSAGRYPGYCAGDAGSCRYMDVRNEPEQYQYRHRDLVQRGCGL